MSTLVPQIFRDDGTKFRGEEVAAAFLLGIGEERAAKILNMMDRDEVKEISQAMSLLGTVSAKVVEELIDDFMARVEGGGALIGSYESTERFLAKVLGKDQVDSIMNEIRGPSGRTMWDKLSNVSEDLLASYLKNEYPQTVAVVVSKIKPSHAAKVLSVLPEPFAVEVIQRMLRMESVPRDIVDDIERTLRNEFMNNLSKTSGRDSHAMMAEIFNILDRNTETRFMTALEEKTPDDAEKIKSLMFTFEDLLKLDGSGIQAVIRVVDKSKLALAMKGLSEDLRGLFYKNMSERAAKLMREDIQAMGMVKVRDVDEAQAIMVASAKELVDSGEIVVASSDSEEEMIA